MRQGKNKAGAVSGALQESMAGLFPTIIFSIALCLIAFHPYFNISIKYAQQALFSVAIIGVFQLLLWPSILTIMPYQRLMTGKRKL